jgi:hypothetical protein
MNDVLRPFLRRFVPIFFDDILMYSSSWSEHLQHVRLVLDALRSHSLHLKRSKSSFGVSSVAYLGHIISANSVATDNDKVDAVLSWLEPRSAWDVRGLLGLAGYNRNLSGTSTITTPLTWLLCKDTFA